MFREKECYQYDDFTKETGFTKAAVRSVVAELCYQFQHKYYLRLWIRPDQLICIWTNWRTDLRMWMYLMKKRNTTALETPVCAEEDEEEILWVQCQQCIEWYYQVCVTMPIFY